jgi:ribosomal protein S18 acetylase RimI-like enzyme
VSLSHSARFDRSREGGIILGMTIRPMTEADLDQVMELEKAIFASPWRRSFFLSDINRPQGLSVVAEEDGVILGCPQRCAPAATLRCADVRVPIP